MYCPKHQHFEIAALMDLSTRLGRDPLLTQGNSGNTSLKLGDTLWIKAAGQCLADARPDIFLPVELAAVRACVHRRIDPAQQAVVAANGLRPSIETAMHAVLPHAVVIHVHSVNTIAWAIREDAPALLEQLLHGIEWRWIPYVPSGLSLALEIEKVAAAKVLILANHGLVVCAEDCDAAESLLQDVERRLSITPRRPPDPDWNLLARLADGSPWIMPADPALHALGSDPVSSRILSGGFLFPCQSVFSQSSTPKLFHAVRCQEPSNRCQEWFGGRPLLIVEAAGTLVKQAMTRADNAMLGGLAEVVQRTSAIAPIHYLPDAGIDH